MAAPGKLAPRAAWKPSVLAIVPPYTLIGPPAGAAALLGYLRSQGCDDFDFLDLRLAVPSAFAPTYRSIGAFGETYVIDVPDLPLVLKLLNAARTGGPLFTGVDEDLEQYCAERLIGVASLAEYLTAMERYLRGALAQLPDLRFVGFSVWTSNFLTTLMAAAILKQRARPPVLVAGGPQVTESTASARLGLAAGLFDAVVQGEGEEALLAVYRSYQRGEALGVGPGVLTNALPPDAAPEIPAAPATPSLLRIQDLPAPDFDGMDLAAYALSPDGPTVLYQLSRGCTDRCSFCSEWVFWRRFRSLDPQQCVEQLADLQRRYGFTDVLFTDSLLNGSIPRLRAFAEGLLARGLRFQWGGFMRAQMDAETLAVLKRAGLRWVNIGIESMSDATLDLMNKRRTEADNVRALRLFLEHGIVVQSGLIPGFPGDTRQRFLHTIRQLLKLKQEFPALLSFTNEPFTVSPSQPIYRQLDTFGLSTVAWPERTRDLAPEHRAITDTIVCSVEGSNQGVDRMGESALIPFFDGGMRGQTPFSYALSEKFSMRELDIESMEGSWVLARCKLPNALLYGCILTGDERLQFSEAVEQAPAAALEADCILDAPAVARLMRRIERSHVLPPDRDRSALLPLSSSLPLVPDALLALSPHVVGRIMDGEPELVLAHVVASRAVAVSARLAPVLKPLRKTPRTVAELGRQLRRAGVPLSEAEWLETARNLWSMGFLVSLSTGAVAEDAPATKHAVLTPTAASAAGAITARPPRRRAGQTA